MDQSQSLYVAGLVSFCIAAILALVFVTKARLAKPSQAPTPEPPTVIAAHMAPAVAALSSGAMAGYVAASVASQRKRPAEDDDSYVEAFKPATTTLSPPWGDSWPADWCARQDDAQSAPSGGECFGGYGE